MAFTRYLNTAVGTGADIDGYIDALGAAMILSGWTDDAGHCYHSAADSLSRRCYCKLEKQNAVGVDYLKITLNNTAGFGGTGMVFYGHKTGADTFPDTFFYYGNEYWFMFYDKATDDATCAYATYCGLYYTTRTIAENDGPLFFAYPRAAAAAAETLVAWHDLDNDNWFAINGTVGGSIAGGLLGPHCDGEANADDQTTIPYIKGAGVARLCNNGTGRYGRLFYAYMLPDPALPEGTTLVDNAIAGQYYYALSNANDNGMNLIVRTI